MLDTGLLTLGHSTPTRSTLDVQADARAAHSTHDAGEVLDVQADARRAGGRTLEAQAACSTGRGRAVEGERPRASGRGRAAEGEATTRRASAQKERTLRVVRVVAGGFPYPGPPGRRAAGALEAAAGGLPPVSSLKTFLTHSQSRRNHPQPPARCLRPACSKGEARGW